MPKSFTVDDDYNDSRLDKWIKQIKTEISQLTEFAKNLETA